MRLGYLIRLAQLVLIRSWRSTVVLGGMVTLAVSTLIVITALAIGTNDAMVRNSTGLFSGHISIAMPQNTQQHVRDQELGGVGLRRIQISAVIGSQSNQLEPVRLIGVEPDREAQYTAFARKVIAGHYLSSGTSGLLVSADAAERLHVKIGDRISLFVPSNRMMLSVPVTGIYRTGISAFDAGVAFVPATLIASYPVSLSYAVFLPPAGDLTDTVNRLRAAFPDAHVMPWTEFMPDLKQLIDLDNICMGILIVLVFAIVAAGLASIFTVFTLKNLRDHGIMQALGFRNSDTAVLLVLQITLLTVVASVIGAVIGWGMVEIIGLHGVDISRFTSHNQYFSVSGMLYPRATIAGIAAPPITAILFSVIAAVWPVMIIVRRTPAEILRSL